MARFRLTSAFLATATLVLTGCPAPQDDQAEQDEPAFPFVAGQYQGGLNCDAALSTAGSSSATLFEQSTSAEMTLTIDEQEVLTVAGTVVEPGAVLTAAATSIVVDQTVTEVIREPGRIRVRYSSDVSLEIDGEARRLPGSGEYVITGREDGTIGFKETSRLTIEEDDSGFEALLTCNGGLSRVEAP